MNVHGSYRCVPKETGKIKPMILGEPIEFFIKILKSHNVVIGVILFFFFIVQVLL